ncbi:MAG: ATP-binding domain-containing protein, partial [Bdellovibrionales bacterium]|nr:ATP-binding domain-containing protein [Bdellovibrionales bacterium]
KLFRRSEDSSINDIAHCVNAGQVPEIPEPDGRTRTDAYFIARPDAVSAAQLVESLVADQIPNKFNIPSSEIWVLTPSNRGPLGVQALNGMLQQSLNPMEQLDSEQLITVGDHTFRLRDRVCQRVNNYQIDPNGVFNGDVGTISSVDRQNESLKVELWDGRLIEYQRKDLSQLALGYALTVHRSQGSEVPCVVLTLHESHYTLLERQLIYTAITRAKKLLIIVGSKKALALACRRTNASRRLTNLRDRIIS